MAAHGAQQMLNKTIGHCLGMLTGTVLSQILGMVRAIMMPGLLGPTQFGIWNLANVVVGYGANSHLGVLHGFNKLMPGLKDDSERRALLASAFWANAVLGAIAAAMVFAISFCADSAYVIALRFSAIAIFLQAMVVFVSMAYRSCSQFHRLSVSVVVQSVVSTILVVGGAWLCADGLKGALSGLVLSLALTVCFMFWLGGFSIGLTGNGEWVRRSFRLGFAQMVIAIIDILLMSADRWLVAYYFEATELGYYALGILVCSVMGFFPSAVSNVLFPRMVAMRSSGGSESDLMLLYSVPVWLVPSVMMLGGGAVVIMMPWITAFFLPKFTGAVPVIGILGTGSYFVGMAILAGNYVIAVDRQKLLPLVQVTALVTGLMTLVFAVKFNYGLCGAAVGTMVGYAVYGLGYLMLAEWSSGRSWMKTAVRMGQAMLFYLLCMALLALMMTSEKIFAIDVSGLFGSVVKCLIYAVIVLVMCVYLSAGGFARMVGDLRALKALG